MAEFRKMKVPKFNFGTPKSRTQTPQQQFDITFARKKAAEPFELAEEERRPELAAQIETAKVEAKVKAPREILLENMNRLKSLADAVPAGKPGVDRFIEGGISTVKGFFQTLPQLNTYNRNTDVILGSVVQTIGGETGSRLSDQDIERMRGAFPKLPFDSDVQRALQWDIFFDTVNDVARKYGADPFPKEQFFNENDIALLSEIPGSTFFGQGREPETVVIDQNTDETELIKQRLREKYSIKR